MNPWVAGALAAVPGAGAVVLAAVHIPSDARLWIWVAAVGVLLAVHPALRWASMLGLVGLLVGVTLRAGVTGLPVTVAAGLGILALVYLLAIDLAELVGRAEGKVMTLAGGWAAAMALPVAAGLGACAVALAVVGAPVAPSLPLALAGPVAVVALGVLAMRSRTTR